MGSGRFPAENKTDGKALPVCVCNVLMRLLLGALCWGESFVYVEVGQEGVQAVSGEYHGMTGLNCKRVMS